MFVLFLQFLFLNAYEASAAALNMYGWLVGCWVWCYCRKHFHTDDGQVYMCIHRLIRSYTGNTDQEVSNAFH